MYLSISDLITPVCPCTYMPSHRHTDSPPTDMHTYICTHHTYNEKSHVSIKSLESTDERKCICLSEFSYFTYYALQLRLVFCKGYNFVFMVKNEILLSIYPIFLCLCGGWHLGWSQNLIFVNIAAINQYLCGVLTLRSSRVFEPLPSLEVTKLNLHFPTSVCGFPFSLVLATARCFLSDNYSDRIRSQKS